MPWWGALPIPSWDSLLLILLKVHIKYQNLACPQIRCGLCCQDKTYTTKGRPWHVAARLQLAGLLLVLLGRLLQLHTLVLRQRSKKQEKKSGAIWFPKVQGPRPLGNFSAPWVFPSYLMGDHPTMDPTLGHGTGNQQQSGGQSASPAALRAASGSQPPHSPLPRSLEAAPTRGLVRLSPHPPPKDPHPQGAPGCLKLSSNLTSSRCTLHPIPACPDPTFLPPSGKCQLTPTV